MNIEKFLNRLRYGFYTIESIPSIADRRIGLIIHGLIGAPWLQRSFSISIFYI